MGSIGPRGGGGLGGGGPNSGELSEGAHEAFGRLPLFRTAPCQGRLGGSHSEAPDVKKARERKMMRIGVRNETHCRSEGPTAFMPLGALSAYTPA